MGGEKQSFIKALICCIFWERRQRCKKPPNIATCWRSLATESGTPLSISSVTGNLWGSSTEVTVLQMKEQGDAENQMKEIHIFSAQYYGTCILKSLTSKTVFLSTALCYGPYESEILYKKTSQWKAVYLMTTGCKQRRMWVQGLAWLLRCQHYNLTVRTAKPGLHISESEPVGWNLNFFTLQMVNSNYKCSLACVCVCGGETSYANSKLLW